MIVYDGEILGPELNEYFLELIGQKLLDIGAYYASSILEEESFVQAKARKKEYYLKELQEEGRPPSEFFNADRKICFSLRFEKQEIIIGRRVSEELLRMRFYVTEEDAVFPKDDVGELLSLTRYVLISARMDPEFSSGFFESLLDQTVSGIDLIRIKEPAEEARYADTDEEFWEFCSGVIFHLESGRSFAVGYLLDTEAYYFMKIMDASEIDMKYVSEIIPVRQDSLKKSFAGIQKFFRKIFRRS